FANEVAILAARPFERDATTQMMQRRGCGDAGTALARVALTTDRGGLHGGIGRCAAVEGIIPEAQRRLVPIEPDRHGRTACSARWLTEIQTGTYGNRTAAPERAKNTALSSKLRFSARRSCRLTRNTVGAMITRRAPDVAGL